MYKESPKKNVKSLLLPAAAFVLGVLLLAVLSILNIKSFAWLYELFIIAIIISAIYLFFKNYIYVYHYILAENKFAINLTLAKRESTLCVIDIKDIIVVIKSEYAEKYFTQYEIKKKQKYYNSYNFDNNFTVFYKGENNQNFALVFQPSDKFFAILNEKMLDNKGNL